MKKEVSPTFDISVTIGSETYKGSGESAFEALQTLEQPTKIFQKGIVTLTHNGKSRTLMLMPQRIKRLWWKLAQPVIAKGFEQGLIGAKV